ncbi:MAG: hypothetical protein K9L82_09460 [Chromatiaceae bacterium]|nr:hypothetical protein [Chromatiaceae bacterium]MCF7993713.1 hypothetical protein [Chromatiaceae bacterium]MCF8014932.1 hypothetical protein [Chromatiaceae bacterium]
MACRSCSICLGEFHRESHRRSDRARTCRHELAAPGPDCWFEKGGLHQKIAESLLLRRPSSDKAAETRERLLRDLHRVADVGAPLARQHLQRLSDHDRWLLLKFSAPGLRDWLLAIYRDDELIARPALKPVQYPDLPELLLQRLRAWEDKNRSRLETRIKNGHSRSPDAVRRMMAEPIALAKFLAENGIDRWEAMTMRDRIAFAKTRPKRVQQKLKPFITFLEGCSPFKTRRGRPPKKAQKSLREARQIPILSVDELKERLQVARGRLPPDQYLLYWLVAKLGLTAKAAYGLTLDRVTINASSRLVICPAEAWFALPQGLATTMHELARNADPDWPYEVASKAAAIPIFASVIPKHRLGPDIFRGETVLLRSSAIHAAMHYGQLDRKTLAAITGVSLQTISEMEFLVPADIHSLMSRKLVEARNRAILGDEDD